MNATHQWFYADASNQQAGPVPEAELHALRRDRVITDSTYVWREGMSGWEPLSSALPTPTAVADPIANILTARLAQAQKHTDAARQAATRRGRRVQFMGAIGLLVVGASVLFAAHVTKVKLRSAATMRVNDAFGTIEKPPDWLAGRDPRHMSLDEKMAVADRYLAAMERAIPTFAAALRANHADPYCDISQMCDQFNRLTASNPFNALAFPCTQAREARNASAKPTAFERWFDDYRRREAALIAQLDGAGS